MRNTLLASLVIVAAGCTAEQTALAPAQGSVPPEPLSLSVRGTQANGPIVAVADARRPRPTSSTSPTGPVWIETTCLDKPVEAQIADLQREYPATTAVDVGKTALLVDHGKRQQLTAWDTDSNCRVDITGPKDVDTSAIARTLLGELRS